MCLALLIKKLSTYYDNVRMSLCDYNIGLVFATLDDRK